MMGSIETGIWYDQMPNGAEYSISGIRLEMNDMGYVEDNSFIRIGFKNCRNLSNCGARVLMSNITTDSRAKLTVHGFDSCQNLTNCIAEIQAGGNKINGGKLEEAAGFYACSNLVCCDTNMISFYVAQSGYNLMAGFWDCENLLNCEATKYSTASAASGSAQAINGFYRCVKLTNCTGAGNGDYHSMAGFGAIGFSYCSYLSCCTGVKGATQDQIWNQYTGATTKRDDDSCMTS